MASGTVYAPKPRAYRFQMANGAVNSGTVATLSNLSVPGNEVYLDNNHIKFNMAGIVRININVIGQAYNPSSTSTYRLWGQLVVGNAGESTGYVHLANAEYASVSHGATLYVTPSTDMYYYFVWAFGVGTGFNSVPCVIEVLVL